MTVGLATGIGGAVAPVGPGGLWCSIAAPAQNAARRNAIVQRDKSRYIKQVVLRTLWPDMRVCTARTTITTDTQRPVLVHRAPLSYRASSAWPAAAARLGGAFSRG